MASAETTSSFCAPSPVARPNLTELHRPWINLQYLGPGDVDKQIQDGLGLNAIVREVNNGNAIAKNVRSVGDVYIAVPGAEAENIIFHRIQARMRQQDTLPSYDQLPGKEDSHSMVVGGRGNQKLDGTTFNYADANAAMNGTTVIYVAGIVQYQDARGANHYTEMCLFGTNLVDSMRYCTEHNTLN